MAPLAIPFLRWADVRVDVGGLRKGLKLDCLGLAYWRLPEHERICHVGIVFPVSTQNPKPQTVNS